MELANVRPADMDNADLVRRTTAAITKLDKAHERYCSKLERRASRRAASLRRECDARSRAAKEGLAEARAAQKLAGDLAVTEELVRSAETWVRTCNDMALQLDRAQKAMDDNLRRWGDRFVVGALRSASSKNGGRAFLKALSKGTDVAITVVGVPLPHTAAIARVAKKVTEFLARKIDKGPRAATNARYETALMTLGAATEVMRDWAAAIK